VHRALLPLLLALAVTTPRRRWLGWLLAALAAATVANLSWLAAAVPRLGEVLPVLFPDALRPVVRLGGNLLALALVLVAVSRLFANEPPTLTMARRLARRGDHRGAGEAFLRAGRHRRAVREFRKAHAWQEAAKAALLGGDLQQAADLFRLVGGEFLEEAARLYRRLGRTDAARECDAELARWLAERRRFDDAVTAWLRAGEPLRAVRAARLALSAGKLKPDTRAFLAARRAAEAADDHEILARLAELTGDLEAAGMAWRRAGRLEEAARCLRRAGQLERAAEAEEASGRFREATLLRLELARGWRERLEGLEAGRGPRERAELERRLAELERRLVRDLERLGLQEELVQLLVASGRTREAIEHLVARGDLERAADVAEAAQLWDTAASLLEKAGRWGAASDMWELAGRLADAARCAEYAGEDERARLIYRKLGDVDGEARCLARSGRLQEGVAALHAAGRLDDAWQLLREHPGPIPDIPDVAQDVAEHLWNSGRRHEAVACLQRAVVGVALNPQRLGPPLALARYLHELGDSRAALGLLERVIEYDYTVQPAHLLRQRILATQPTAPSPAADGGATPVPSVRSVEQRYEIVEEIGRGGVGVVYRAFDRELERTVAIKVLRTTREEEIERLRQEAKAAARLEHPGIVRVHDFLRGFGGHFIVMEYVEGRPLDALLRDDADAVRAHLVEIAVQLAEAVAYAHSRKVVHRDVKPGNVLVTPDWRTKVLDFGIAARLDSEGDRDDRACGTPYYMAPEQIRGEPPTPATDVYSLGATLYHLATGQPPFRRNIIEGHLNQRPKSPADLNPNLPPGFTEIVLRCLEKAPEARYPSAAELAEALRRLVA